MEGSLVTAVGSDETGLMAWEPHQQLRNVSSAAARLSRGFLRCQPAKWFPGFATQWLPLIHSLGIEAELVDVKPLVQVPDGLTVGYAGTVDDEPLAILTDRDSMRVWIEAASPNAITTAQQVIAEYTARRILGSLAIAWSGPESSVVQFDKELKASNIRAAGTIKVVFRVNGQLCTVWFVLGKFLVERFDGLWRRQLQSTSRTVEDASTIGLEISQLAVPPSMLSEYTRSGTVIDLEVAVSDVITLRVGGKPWVPARLWNVDGKFGFEILQEPLVPWKLPEGTTRLSIQFKPVNPAPGTTVELMQQGAIYECPDKLDNHVTIAVNDERVATARLCCFEGRFAITVE
jgi:hypothetical protein